MLATLKWRLTCSLVLINGTNWRIRFRYHLHVTIESPIFVSEYGSMKTLRQSVRSIESF
jgi:hypothetical protein